VGTRRFVGLAAAIALVPAVALVTGCTAQAHRPQAQPAPSVTVVKPSPTVTILRTGRVVRAGTTVPFRAQAGVALSIRASRPTLSRERLSSSYGYAPSHGYYVTFVLTLANTGTSSVDIGPGDFYVRVSRQGTVTTLMGNAPYSGASAQLDNTQLDAGQTISGPLTFDVRSPHGTLAFAPDGSPAVSWTY
jgi:hypothetical protein